MPKKIFFQELEGTRRRGRPRKRWKEGVERDLQVLGVTGQSPQWAVVPMEEEEEEDLKRNYFLLRYLKTIFQLYN